MLDQPPAERHQEVAAGFSAVAAQVTDWDAPTPVPNWRARDVIRHLIDWSTGFLAGGAEVRLPANDHDDPYAAWQAHAGAVQSLLDDPSTADRVLRNPHIGEVPLPQAITNFYTGDVFMHTWDLAQSAGVADGLDEQDAAAMLEGMRPMDALLRSSGQYGPAMPAPDDAPAATRLMAFVGRDPAWRERPA